MSADPFWNYVKLLCHFDGIDGGKRFVDERHNPVVQGASAALSTLHKKFGATAGYFNGTTSSEIYWSSPAGISPGSQDFTVEGWVYLRDQAAPGNWVFGFGNSLGVTANGAVLFADMAANPGKFAVVVSTFSTTTPLLVSTSSIVYDQFVAVAITRSNTTWRLFINGVLEATATLALADVSAPTFRLSHPGYPLLGYLDEFRLTVGVCRYIENFTPATAAFPQSGAIDPHYGSVVLHCHFNGENGSGTFVDQKGHSLISDSATPPTISATQSRFGGAALLASTSGAYQRLKTTSQDYVIGTADFCVEFFYRSFGNLGVFGDVLRLVGADGVTKALQLSVDTYASNPLRLTINGSNTVFGSGAGISSWEFSHVAICRSGGYVQVYVNGVARITPINMGGQSIGSNGVLYLGGAPDGDASRGMYGYLDEFRFTIGAARYTANFTPPTDPFPDYALQKLTGTVFDADNNPVAKTVRSYRTSDGLLIDQSVSDATTGAFELRATDTSEHFVVVHDDTKNALVYDHIVPVI